MSEETKEKRKLGCSHEYAPLDRSYYKQDGGTTGLGLPKTDQSITYMMLFCHKCGDTIEVISKDHRKKEEEDD